MSLGKIEKSIIDLDSIRQHARYLPTIIFVEDHWDPANISALNVLFPSLAKLGYKRFYEELPQGETLESVYKETTKYIADYTQLSEKMKKMGLDIQNEKDIITFALKSNLPINKVFSAVNNLAQRYRGYLESVQLYSFFKVENIEYKAIDMPNVGEFANIISTLTPLRDSLFTQEYIKSNKPTIGRHGLGHTEGIQKFLLKEFGQEYYDYLKNKFCFIYIYSRPVSDGSQIQEDIRNKKISFPLGLIQVNSNEVTHESLLTLVSNEIQRRTCELSKLKSSFEKETPNINVPSTSYLKLRTPLGFFTSKNSDKKYDSQQDTNRSIELTDSSLSLNVWKKEALKKYLEIGLTEKDLSGYCNTPPFIQIHLDLMRYFIEEKAFTPLNALKEMNELPKSILKHMRKLQELGVRGDYLREFHRLGICFGKAHVLMLEHLIQVRNHSPKDAVKQICGLSISDAKKYCTQIETENTNDTNNNNNNISLDAVIQNKNMMVKLLEQARLNPEKISSLFKNIEFAIQFSAEELSEIALSNEKIAKVILQETLLVNRMNFEGLKNIIKIYPHTADLIIPRANIGGLRLFILASINPEAANAILKTPELWIKFHDRNTALVQLAKMHDETAQFLINNFELSNLLTDNDIIEIATSRPVILVDILSNEKIMGKMSEAGELVLGQMFSLQSKEQPPAGKSSRLLM
ncbi:Uncharacterised protein [Legionella wadsworthii]|uniref:Uncharacterized protein n=1 Tax=Legionella wadsworthii TaxID=28088 RepID=A0A378LS28_9GAMM|nr:hypothetical protein [Legionella wadsworthii]STY29497.1 Uncharacterised protein [Legionella wadsworthii]